MEQRPTINSDSESLGNLIIGNHDSLTAFSNEAESKLQLVSKTVSEIVIRGTGDIELVITQILEELGEIEADGAEHSSPFSFSRWKVQRKLTQKYEALLHQVDDMTLALKLQQASLIKETILLKKLEPTLIECRTDFEADIAIAEKISEALKCGENNAVLRRIPPEEMKAWQSRFERKLESIRISHTVVMQTLAQTKLLRENNQHIIDRISAAITNTIPIWRNQIMIALNVERSQGDALLQNKLANTITSSISHESERLRKTLKKSKAYPIDINKVRRINEELVEVLNNLIAAEKADNQYKQLLSASSSEQE